MKQSKFLSLKEFVVVLLLACVETAIGLVVTMPFAANLQLVYFLAPGLAGLINGIIYVLIIKKCPKIGTQFIIPAIYGLYFLFSGSVYVFIFFMILEMCIRDRSTPSATGCPIRWALGRCVRFPLFGSASMTGAWG